MVTAIVERTVELPDGVTCTVGQDYVVNVNGPNGQLSRELNHPKIVISVADGNIVVRAQRARRPIAALVGTFAGHLQNMVNGAQRDFEAHCKAVNAHFPIKMKQEGEAVVIENFLGEKAPRRADIRPGVKVQIKGAEITITGADKEAVGQTAANLEQATTVRRRDRRVFQDGVYITSKPR